MTIQVGHPHKCPTFFCAPSRREVNESTSQRVNKLVSDRSYKPDSADAAKCKSPFLLFCQIYAPFATYINHNIS